GMYVDAGVGPVSMQNVTITNNSATAGGGLYNLGSVSMRNSILAGNTGTPDCFTHLVSGGHNLIGNATNCTISGVTTGNKTGNPGLAPLGNYGGPTQTHALLPGSAAIDAGDPTGCTGYNGILTTDQRGAPRTFDGDGNGSAICDMGAFENYDFDGDGYL